SHWLRGQLQLQLPPGHRLPGPARSGTTSRPAGQQLGAVRGGDFSRRRGRDLCSRPIRARVRGSGDGEAGADSGQIAGGVGADSSSGPLISHSVSPLSPWEWGDKTSRENPDMLAKEYPYYLANKAVFAN